jgi:DNA-binding HxlR family transcriptional regulator
MKWDDIGEVRCSIARSMAVLGDRWTLLIVRDAFLGIRRFEDFQANLGASRHVLSARLRKLVDAGILRREPYQERPRRHEYRLTEKGLDLHPVLVALVGWGDRWLTDEHGPPLTYTHRPCGQEITPTLACPHCTTPITPQDLQPHFHPLPSSSS